MDKNYEPEFSEEAMNLLKETEFENEIIKLRDKEMAKKREKELIEKAQSPKEKKLERDMEKG